MLADLRRVLLIRGSLVRTQLGEPLHLVRSNRRGKVNVVAEGHDDVTSQVSWKSSDKKRVSVKTGLVRAIKTGAPVTVTASKGHKGRSGSATVTVN